MLIAMAIGSVAAARSGGVTPLLRLELSAQAGHVDFTYRGRPLAVYEFRPAPQRPCVRRFCNLEGFNVLNEATPEAGPSRGLGLGFRVNGVSFSEPGPENGWQRSGPEISRRITRDKLNRAVAEIGHLVYWLPSRESPVVPDGALLIEDRRLRFLVDEWSGEVAIEWESSFEVGSRFDQVHLEASPGQGLTLTLASKFSPPIASISDEVSQTGPIQTQADRQWITCQASFGDRPVGVTLFNEPEASARPSFHSEPAPYPAMSASLGLEGAGMILRAGARFRVRALIALHAHRLTAEALAERREQWLAAAQNP